MGVYFSRSSSEVMLSCDRLVLVKAWIVIGTFWMLWLRRWAVTTISWMSVAEALADVASSAAWAANGAKAKPLAKAAMAQEIL